MYIDPPGVALRAHDLRSGGSTRFLIHRVEPQASAKRDAVRVSNQPWAVDPALGGCGVCYFGNLGEKPTLNDGLFILRKNRKDIDTFSDNVD